MRGYRGERDILADAHRQECALVLAILRHVANSGRDRSARRFDDDGFAVQSDGSARGSAHPEQTLGGLRPPSADETVEAENLTAAEAKRYIGELRRVGQAFDFENRLADRDIPFGKHLIDRSSNHLTHEIGLRSVRDETASHHFAVA